MTVRQLAAFHTQGNTATFFWHTKASTTTSTVLTHVGVDGQSVLPRKNDAGNTVAQGTFTPTGAFGLKIDPEWSDPTRNSSTADNTNGCPTTSQCGHHLRIWPAKDRSGAVIANTYLVSMDYSGINYDYNDNVYLVSNMKPETATDPSAPGPVPGASALQLEFDAAVAGTLADKDGQGTGFRSTQPNERDLTVGSDSYLASAARPRHHGWWLTAGDQQRHAPPRAPTAATTTRWSTACGCPSTAPATRSASSRGSPGPSRSTTRAPSRRASSSATTRTTSSRSRVIEKTVGAHDRPGHRVPRRAGRHRHHDRHAGRSSRTPRGVTTIDVALLADPGARTVKAAYRTNGGAWTVLPTTFSVPATFAGQAVRRAFATPACSSPTRAVSSSSHASSPSASSSGNATGGAPAAREALLRLDTGSSTLHRRRRQRLGGRHRSVHPDHGARTRVSAPTRSPAPPRTRCTRRTAATPAR